MLRNKIASLNLFLGAALVLLLLTSCHDEKRTFEEITAIEGGIWKRNDPVEFTFEIEDTTKIYNIIYHIRNNVSYKYANLYLNYSMMDEKGETVENGIHDLILFGKTGKPIGKKNLFGGGSIGSAYDHRKAFFLNYKFKRTGTYKINLKQFMRNVEELEDITHVGIRVERIN